MLCIIHIMYHIISAAIAQYRSVREHVSSGGNMMRYAMLSLVLAGTALGARILCFYTIPSISHQIVFRELTKELAARGHDLVVITPDPYLPKDRPPDNVREIDTHFSYDVFRRIMGSFAREAGDPVQDCHNIILKACHAALDEQFGYHEVREIIQNETERFDLVIIEGLVRPLYYVTHRFKAPVIAFNSLPGIIYNYEATGTPHDPIMFPDLVQKRVFNPTLWDKAELIYKDLYHRYRYWRAVDEDNEMGRKYFGSNSPDVRELIKNVDLLFLNAHPVWDGIRPVPPNVIYIGGMHLAKPEPLSEELKRYMDNCTQGVLYMSLGTNVKSSELPEDKRDIFVKVFSKLPYCVLWKWEDMDLQGKPENVRVKQWWPQRDLLSHPNVLAFITQGGQQSVDEAIDGEVPLIGIPFLADQENNVNKFSHHGVGAALDIKTLTQAKLLAAIHKVIHDKSYRSNMKRLRAIIHDQPMTSKERAVWWVEYLLRHGTARHLRSPSADDGFSVYPLAFVALACLSILVHLLSLLRYFCTGKDGTKKKAD